MPRLPNTEENFWEKVNYFGPLIVPALGNCWEWEGTTDGNGYGVFCFEKQTWHVSRLAMKFKTGEEVPPEKHVSTICRNTLCVRHQEVIPVSAVSRKRHDYSGKWCRKIEKDES